MPVVGRFVLAESNDSGIVTATLLVIVLVVIGAPFRWRSLYSGLWSALLCCTLIVGFAIEHNSVSVSVCVCVCICVYVCTFTDSLYASGEGVSVPTLELDCAGNLWRLKRCFYFFIFLFCSTISKTSKKTTTTPCSYVNNTPCHHFLTHIYTHPHTYAKSCFVDLPQSRVFRRLFPTTHVCSKATTTTTAVAPKTTIILKRTSL